MEQGTGIEPAFTAWEAVVLPIYEPCVSIGAIIAKKNKKFKSFLSGVKNTVHNLTTQQIGIVNAQPSGGNVGAAICRPPENIHVFWLYARNHCFAW